MRPHDIDNTDGSMRRSWLSGATGWSRSLLRGNGDEEELRRSRVILMFWLVGALPWPLVFATVYGGLLHCLAGFWICLACFGAFLPIPVILTRTGRARLCGHWMVTVILATLTALALVTGGSGAPALIWMITIPLVATHILDYRAGMMWCGVVVVGFTFFEALRWGRIDMPQLLSDQQIPMLAFVGNLGVVILVTTLSTAYDTQRREAMHLAENRQRQLRVALDEMRAHADRLARSEEALRKSEALYRNLVQNSPMGMLFYTLCPDGKLLLNDANPAAETLTGLAMKELMGKSIEQAFPSLATTEVPSRYRAAARDGVAWTAEQLRYDDGRISGVFDLRAFQTSPGNMVVVFSNVTDRAAAEAAARASEREAALHAGKAEVATDVLHNVGNVLSRVNVTTKLLLDRFRSSEIATLGLVLQAFNEHATDLPRFLTEDERGRRLPGFLDRLAHELSAEQSAAREELEDLSNDVEHIALIVGMQQVHSKGLSKIENVRPDELIDQALSISIGSRHQDTIDIRRDFEALGPVDLYRHKLIQILVNLLNNAKHALLVSQTARPCITIGLRRRSQTGQGGLRIAVADNGIGIRAEHLPRIFTFGFTTREDGHGFGLHSVANLVQEMGGWISVASEGPGRGATFTLEVPLAKECVSP